MKAPAVAIDVHHALTPELRERIIDDIRTRIQEPSYRLLSPEQLRELARLDTGGPPLVSPYFATDARAARGARMAFGPLGACPPDLPFTGREGTGCGRGRPRPDRARAERP